MITKNWLRAFGVALIAALFAYFISSTLQTQRHARYVEDLSQQVYHRGFSEYFQWLNALQSGGVAAASKTPFSAYITQTHEPVLKEADSVDWKVDLSLHNLESQIFPHLPLVSQAGIMLELSNKNWNENIVVRWDITTWADQLAADIGYGPLVVNISYNGYTLTNDENNLINPKVFDHFIFNNMTLTVDDKSSMKPLSELLLALLNGMAVGSLAGILVYVFLSRRDYNEIVLQKLRNQLVASNRLAGLGEFSANLVHEIKSPIAVIHSNLQVLKSEVAILGEQSTRSIEDDQSYAKKTLEIMHGSVDDCLAGSKLLTDIVRDMTQIAVVEQEKRLCDFNAKVNSVLNLTRILRPKNIHIEKHLIDIPPIFCNPASMIQVVLNIVVNATQALEAKGGTITLSEHIDDTYLYLVISDNGPGMSKEVAKRIFEPFFTTRLRVGTGLGLALSKRLVEEHDGALLLETSLGKGTTFTVKVPIGHS